MLTAKDAERLLKDNGFTLLRVKGSHYIYGKDQKRMIVPFHPGKTLHPKIIKQVLEVIKE